MTDATTIKLNPDTKQALEAENLDGETFDETVARLLGATSGSTWTEKEIREIATQAAEETIRQYQR